MLLYKTHLILYLNKPKANEKVNFSNPAFRYIFEIFIIVFSVTVSFYIQNELNERDKMELKNESLKGVLIDLDKDKDYLL